MRPAVLNGTDPSSHLAISSGLPCFNTVVAALIKFLVTLNRVSAHAMTSFLFPSTLAAAAHIFHRRAIAISLHRDSRIDCSQFEESSSGTITVAYICCTLVVLELFDLIVSRTPIPFRRHWAMRLSFSASSAALAVFASSRNCLFVTDVGLPVLPVGSTAVPSAR